MRTSLAIDEQLQSVAKRRGKERRVSLRSVVEEALRRELAPP